MQALNREVNELHGLSPSTFPDDIVNRAEPVVLRQFVKDWPLVRAAKSSDQDARKYIRSFYNGEAVTVTCGSPDIHGYISYTEGLEQPNVKRRSMDLCSLLNLCSTHSTDSEPPLYYMASTDPDECLPGLTKHNPMQLGGKDLLESIWIGNHSIVPAHYDLPDNIACVAVGKRKFTLFPPEQLKNLYIGPLDMTPAGQSISVVDFRTPDFEKYPKYKEALASAQSAELEPGDAIFIPSMWWHQVEAQDKLNMLINYWWRQSPAYMGPPIDALLHTMLTVRDLPAAQKEAWREMFNHYVFESPEEVAAHIPQHVRGSLSPVTDNLARRIRAYLLNRLNR